MQFLFRFFFLGLVPACQSNLSDRSRNRFGDSLFVELHLVSCCEVDPNNPKWELLTWLRIASLSSTTNRQCLCSGRISVCSLRFCFCCECQVFSTWFMFIRNSNHLIYFLNRFLHLISPWRTQFYFFLIKCHNNIVCRDSSISSINFIYHHYWCDVCLCVSVLKNRYVHRNAFVIHTAHCKISKRC